jgi:hypothetical protein
LSWREIGKSNFRLIAQVDVGLWTLVLQAFAFHSKRATGRHNPERRTWEFGNVEVDYILDICIFEPLPMFI